jgi:hypothetical protein
MVYKVLHYLFFEAGYKGMSKQIKTIEHFAGHKKKLWGGFVIALVLSIVYTVFAANMPSYTELIKQLGITQQDLARLDQGDIVFFDISESSERELTAGAAMYVSASPAKISEVIKREDLVSLDTAVIAAGVIPLQATEEAFKGFSFKAGSEAVDDFWEAKPGSQLNLSRQEFQSIKAASPKSLDGASAMYRKFLWQRWQAYRKEGLKGIANYDRGDGEEASPRQELKAALLESKVIEKYFPALYKAWLNYPVDFSAGIEEAFFWSNRIVQGSPTAILVHRVSSSESAGELILARQFYVGRAFNSNQLIIACLPYGKGALVFYLNRTFTDQTAGFGSSLKHFIGDNQAQSEITKLLINLRNTVK